MRKLAVAFLEWLIALLMGDPRSRYYVPRPFWVIRVGNWIRAKTGPFRYP